MPSAPRRVLIADDESTILGVLQEILECADYEVIAAHDGCEALGLLESQPVDIILSDISMPRMDGFQFLHEVSIRYPKLPRVLLTGNLLNDYIDRFLDERVSCVLAKNVPFPVKEILAAMETLLTPDFSWPHYLFPQFDEHEIIRMRSPQEIDSVLDNFSEKLPAARRKNLKLVLQELLINAMFYGVRNEDGAMKDGWDQHFVLPEEDAIELEWLKDTERFGVAVRDGGGRLDGDTVLHWLDRQTRKDSMGLPVGALDDHGRGLFFSRFFSDRLIVNIQKSVKTEIFSLNWFQQPPVGQKPLLIFQR